MFVSLVVTVCAQIHCKWALWCHWKILLYSEHIVGQFKWLTGLKKKSCFRKREWGLYRRTWGDKMDPALAAHFGPKSDFDELNLYWLLSTILEEDNFYHRHLWTLAPGSKTLSGERVISTSNLNPIFFQVLTLGYLISLVSMVTPSARGPVSIITW